ncbi:hypothetical protein [Lacibacter sediminis]|uniref:Uncharacterized protein n=1 Tax=Lacibacter sediminis TaxID=2760713 RepID=A0A7G5XMC1_9BACT|nr:hypothetical protein [Lacibacter sediminis]QNA46624.1 hypothetical protein H4075_10770 [Lacibacter sediminis]
MQRVYLNTSIFIFLILIGVQWGFYQTYTSQFPHFKNATPLIHVHGALLMTWMLLLIAQPLLIQTGRAKLHRTIGKVSWVLGPLIVISLFLIGRGGYFRGIAANVPEHENLTFIVLDMRGFLSFAIFWSLAMITRKRPDSHMRYMIATGILAIGPGVGRGLGSAFGMSLGDAITITDALDLVIVGVLLGVDVYRKKNYKPFLTVFLVLLAGSVLWQLRDTALWQSFAKNYAALLYY